MSSIENFFIDQWKLRSLANIAETSQVVRLRILSTADFLNLFLNRNKDFVDVPEYGELTPLVIAAGIISGIKSGEIFFQWVDDSVKMPDSLYTIDSTSETIEVCASGRLTNERHIETDYDLGWFRCCVQKCATDVYSAWRELGDEIKVRK